MDKKLRWTEIKVNFTLVETLKLEKDEDIIEIKTTLVENVRARFSL